MAILVDTGPIVAIVNDRDSHHHDVMACIERTTESLVVPITVLPEVDYLLTRWHGSHVAIRGLELATGQDFRLESVLAADLPRIFELMRQYADSNIGFVDASIVAVAERLRVRKVLTLDRRHFGMIRPRHCPALDILP
jgi:predicted nucleic acid-binding protein